MDADCLNPTAVSGRNSAACESLPSKVANFTSQMFGVVTKTDVDGKVLWTLGCGLNGGLPINPRGFGEGVACYFFRLLYDSIAEFKGAKGTKGIDGTNGQNAVSATTADFFQPTVGSTITVSVVATRALLPGLIVFVENSGWYDVVENDGDTVVLTLREALSFAPVVVVAGAVIVPVSPGGRPITGDKGLPGDKGPDGVAGDEGVKGRDANPNINGYFFGGTKSDFVTTIVNNTPVPVVFDGGFVDVTITIPGTYYIVGTTKTVVGTSAVIFLALITWAVVDNATSVTLSTYNTEAEANAAVKAGQHVDVKIQEVLDTTFQATPYEPRLLQTFFFTVSPRTIRLYVNQDSAPLVKVKASATNLNWVQIA
jgi:hypothetical protein